MSPETEALILDLVEWIAVKPRRYDDVMAAWRTSCPRLPVWEEATDRALVERDGTAVRVTENGVAYLRARGRGMISA